jgi:hypothetical protein
VAQLHRTWWRAVVHMHHLLVSYRPPYYGMGSLLHQMLGGCAPWPGWMGRVVFVPYHLHGLRSLTIFVLTAAGLWQQSVLQRRGVVTHCWCDSGGGYPPSLGGGLRRTNAFWRLPQPLCWVPVGGPSECYPVA